MFFLKPSMLASITFFLISNLILFFPLPPSQQSSYQIAHLDKIVHFSLFFCLALLLLNLYHHYFKVKWNLKFFIYLTAFLIYTTSTEYIQILIPHRNFSFYDLLANYSGIFTAIVLFFRLKK